MLNGGRRRLSVTIRRRLATNDLPKSFNLDLVTTNYEEQTKAATVTPRRTGVSSSSSVPPPLRLVLPPPNVTGRLHIGHALTVTIEDAIARHHRVKGGEATWLPGMDHAGIATQSVVEREIWRKERKTRHEMSRDEFVQRCEHFGKQNATVIRDQMARMGTTLQWEREYYTLDERFSSAVTRAFVTLHRDELIWRDKRFIHWSPALRSSISDQEVDKVELPPGGMISLPSPDGKGRREVRMGVMHTVKYELIDGERGKESSFLAVATTRPETIFADVALAIHPSHPRANELRGKRVKNPMDGRQLPIVIDEGVLAEKGTGVLKITPAHDRLDAEIAARHWKEIEEVVDDARTRSCIDEYGRLHGCGGGSQLNGCDRFEAREAVVQQLAAAGALLQSQEGATTAVSICSRTGDVIEPRQTRQWFLDCREMHAEASRALRSGRLSILPSAQSDRLLEWFSHEEPWCLSRQLAWGHRIPAWKTEGEDSDWIVARSEEEARKKVGRGMEVIMRQDDDVLDTWFSSGLVPLVCGGWMESEGQAAAAAKASFSAPPLSLLETGTDILGFWVARMVMLTMRLSGGQLPFPRVILHGLVRDAEGRKMSKSIGNVVDPLDVIDGITLEKMEKRLGESALAEKEKAKALSSLRTRFPTGIPRCGPDSLRFALLRHDVLAADIPIDVGALAGEGLRFCNKLWNLTAYAAEVRKRVRKELENGMEGRSDVMDTWLRSRLASSLQAVDKHMGDTSIHLAFSSIHHFILASLSDVYVESTKVALWEADVARLVHVSRTLDAVLAESLRQLSVFMPFVSHFLYAQITQNSVYDKTLEYSPSWIDASLEDTVGELLAVASSARSLKQKLGVPNKTAFQGILHSSRPLSNLSPIFPLLAHLSKISIDAVLPLDTVTPEGYEVTSVPGQDTRLALKVEECHIKEMRKVLEEKLHRAIEKKNLYLQKAKRYGEIAEEEKARGVTRLRASSKNQKKSEDAMMVALSAIKEEERIKKMIQ